MGIGKELLMNGKNLAVHIKKLWLLLMGMKKVKEKH